MLENKKGLELDLDPDTYNLKNGLLSCMILDLKGPKSEVVSLGGNS